MANIEYLHGYAGRYKNITKKIKDPVNEEFLAQVAWEMSPKIAENAILIPAPSSSGQNKAILVLALKIASLVPNSKVIEAIKRIKPIQSSFLRRKAGLKPISLKQQIMSMMKVKHIPKNKEIWIIDNIVTSGTTIKAMEYHIKREVNALVYTKALRSTIAKKNPEEPLVITISGSRDFKHLEKIRLVLDTLPPNTIIFHGGAKGVDQYVEMLAIHKGINTKIFPANWRKYGKAAGPIRNREMLDKSDYFIAFWNEISLGTRSAIEYARKIDIDYEVILDE